ncbi:MAG: type II secretion system protein [Clostridia bacterium]|nr:type II secretion system protein [Clostridia bacterium]
MKRNNKKGFTIVELVIVIAVIAILSAVLIPTFGGIVDKANKSAAEQMARNGYTEYYARDLLDGKIDGQDSTVTPVVDLETVDGNATGYKVSADGKTVTFKATKNSVDAIFNGSGFVNAEAE